MAMKHCSKCFEVLPENESYFNKIKHGKNGLFAECKGCRKDHYENNKEEKLKQRAQYYQENKKQIKEKAKTYRAGNQQRIKQKRSEYYQENKTEILRANKKWRNKNKQKIKEYHKNYYDKNKEEILNDAKKYYEENRQRIKEYDAKYRPKYYKENREYYRLRGRKNREKNKEIYKMYTQKYRARKNSLISNFTTDQWQQCLTHFNHQCAYCGSTESLEQEHVIPVSRGGHYTPDNIIPACRSCNASKNNKIMQDWFTQHEIYSVERMANILKYVQKNKTEVNI